MEGEGPCAHVTQNYSAYAATLHQDNLYLYDEQSKARARFSEIIAVEVANQLANEVEREREHQDKKKLRRKLRTASARASVKVVDKVAENHLPSEELLFIILIIKTLPFKFKSVHAEEHTGTAWMGHQS
jgi:hypothetical protein